MYPKLSIKFIYVYFHCFNLFLGSIPIFSCVTDASYQNQERRNTSYERPVPSSSWLTYSDFPLPTFDSFKTVINLAQFISFLIFTEMNFFRLKG